MAFSADFLRPKVFIAAIVLLCAAFVATVGCGKAASTDPEAEVEWKTLSEYMAMDRDAQRQLIWDTRRAIMRKLVAADYDRAECVAGLFDFDKEEGQKQFYNLKGFMKEAAADESSFQGWKAQQVVAYIIKKHLCPESKG